MTTEVTTRKESTHYYHYVIRKGEPHCAAISSNNISSAQRVWLFSMMPDFVDVVTAGDAGLNMAETFLTVNEFATIALRHMQLVEGTYENSTN